MGILRDKKFIKTMLTLAIPITIQSFITSSLNLVDNLMIGKLGEEAIAAVGLANQYFFIFMLCLSGINAGASVFMSQYWGKRDVDHRIYCIFIVWNRSILLIRQYNEHIV